MAVHKRNRTRKEWREISSRADHANMDDGVEDALIEVLNDLVEDGVQFVPHEVLRTILNNAGLQAYAGQAYSRIIDEPMTKLGWQRTLGTKRWRGTIRYPKNLIQSSKARGFEYKGD